MKCIVTGGCGFIGSHVVNTLRQEGHEVYTLDFVERADIRLDICDVKKLIDAFQVYRPEAVFHIAAIANAREALANPVRAVQVNIAGTASVFEAARQSEVKRVILASTCWVAGAMGPGLQDENSPFLPTGAGHIYTTTKIASELIAHDFYTLYKLPFTILRYGIPYGPGMWPGLVLRSFLDCVANNRPITIFGDGSETRNFVYIQDLAHAHALALQEAATNQVYNLEGSRAISIGELAEATRSLFPATTILYQEDASRRGEFQHTRRVISHKKALTELGWWPRISLEEGLKVTARWYNEQVAPLPDSWKLAETMEDALVSAD